MEVQVNCPLPASTVSCNQPKYTENLSCELLKSVQSDINAIGKKFKPAPNLANMNTPISFLQTGNGLSDIRPNSAPSTKLPDTWSWCTDGGNKISPVANQGQCGSCWAVASTTALADRYGVKYNIQAPDLSSAWTILKIGTAGGVSPACQCSEGGLLSQAGCGFETTGVVQEKCYPYEYIIYLMNQTPQGPLPSIEKFSPCCSSDEQDMLFTVKKKSTQNVIVLDNDTNVNVKATHNKLKADIANNGPVASTFLVYSDFQNDYYPNHVMNAENWESVGVYNPNTHSDTPNGGHAVVITGWGTTKEGQDFWEVRNSWGITGVPEGQGLHQGYFKYAIVDDDPCYLAAPGINQNSIVGGGVIFTPGPLPKDYQSKPGTGKRPSPDNYGSFHNSTAYNFFKLVNSNGNLNWPFILSVLLAAVIVVVLLVQLIPNKK
jgi:hypothetical protein